MREMMRNSNITSNRNNDQVAKMTTTTYRVRWTKLPRVAGSYVSVGAGAPSETPAHILGLGSSLDTTCRGFLVHPKARFKDEMDYYIPMLYNQTV